MIFSMNWQRICSLWLFVLIFVFAWSNLASAQVSTSCLAISGQTRTYPVAEGASLNEGVVDFSEPAVRTAYKACANKNFASDLGFESDLSGFAWNPNLGWVAMAASGAGPRYGTAGVQFSDYGFRSFVKFVNNQGGTLRGYWWNDVAGWILLNCADSTDRGLCARSSFGGQVDNLGNVTGFAWSNSLGWIDLTGMRVPTFSQLAIVPDVELEMLPVDANGRIGQIGAPVYAVSNNNGYALALDFQSAGTSLLDRYDFDFDIQFRDQLVAQQVSYNTKDGFSISAPADDRGNADNTLLANKGLVATRFRGGNLIDGYTTGGTDNYQLSTVNNELKLVSRNALVSRVPSVTYLEANGSEVSLLEIVAVNYRAKHKVTGQVYNGFAPKVVAKQVRFLSPYRTVLSQSGSAALNLKLGANPALRQVTTKMVELANISQERMAYYLTEPGVSKYLYCLTANSDYRDCLTLDRENPDNNLNSEGEDPLLGNAMLTFNFAGQVTRLPELLYLYLQLFDLNDEVSAIELSEGTGVYGVSYYRGADSRTYNYIAGQLLNRALQVFAPEVRGAVRLDSFSDLTSQNDNSPIAGGREIGVRENFIRYSESLVRGKSLKAGCSSTNADYRNVRDCWLNFVGQSGQTRKVYATSYSGNSQNVTPLVINNAFLGTDATAYDLVVTGRDVIVDDNLFFAKRDGSLDRDKTLNLFVYKNGSGIGGNVYVRGKANILQAHVFADGSLFSVGNAWNYPTTIANRVPPIRTEEMKEDLYEQFVLLGSLYSKNTLGGCDLPKPRTGNGTLVLQTTIEAREKACLYDLNYFRYSPMIYSEEDGLLVWPDAGDKAVDTLAWQLVRESNDSVAQAVELMSGLITRTFDQSGAYSVVNLVYEPRKKAANLPDLPAGAAFVN
jgi:hypothetical protein